LEKELTDLQATKAYVRHLKQHVQAPVHRFVAISPPELVALCGDELTS